MYVPASQTHTVSSAIRILGKRSRFLAQPQVAVFLPSHSRAVSASKCRDANSASFHSGECWKRANIPPLSYRQALRKPGLLFFPVDTGLYCFFPSLSFSALQLRNGRSLPIAAQSSMTREWDSFIFNVGRFFRFLSSVTRSMPYVPREKDKPVVQRQEGFFHVPELLEPKDRNEVFLFWGLTCGSIRCSCYVTSLRLLAQCSR